MKTRFPLLAPDPGAGGGGNAPDGAPAAPSSDPPAPGSPPAPAVSDEAANPSKGDWVAMAKNVRDLKAQVQTLVSALGQQVAKSTPSTPATPPADAGTAKVEELLAELSFRDALADAGVQVDSARRQKLKTLWHAEGRPDLSEWLPSTVTTFGWTGKPAVAPVAPAAPPAPNASNAGAPVAPQGNAPLDPNPLRWPPSVVDAMSPQKFREALQEYDAKAGKGNPFAAMRRR